MRLVHCVLKIGQQVFLYVMVCRSNTGVLIIP